MEALTQFTSPSASVRGASRLPPLAVATGVGLDIADAGLAAALRDALELRLGLAELAPENAAIVVTDRPLEANDAIPRLHVGAAADRRPGIGSRDPDLILSAAALVAAGYRIERAAPAPGDRPHLSARERQVAELLVDGASNKQIARVLDISVHTAKFHVTAVLDKLGARNRADAVAIMLREGLVSL